MHARGLGVWTNECIIHMRQDAFLPVKGVGLTPHVPGLKGAPLPKIRHDSLTWVFFQSMECPVSIACSASADRSGWALVKADVFFYLCT